MAAAAGYLRTASLGAAVRFRRATECVHPGFVVTDGKQSVSQRAGLGAVCGTAVVENHTQQPAAGGWVWCRGGGGPVTWAGHSLVCVDEAASVSRSPSLCFPLDLPAACRICFFPNSPRFHCRCQPELVPICARKAVKRCLHLYSAVELQTPAELFCHWDTAVTGTWSVRFNKRPSQKIKYCVVLVEPGAS